MAELVTSTNIKCNLHHVIQSPDNTLTMVQTTTVNILAREFVMTTSSYLGTETGHLVLQLPHSVALVHRGGEVVLRADLLVLNTKHFSTNHRLKY